MYSMSSLTGQMRQKRTQTLFHLFALLISLLEAMFHQKITIAF